MDHHLHRMLALLGASASRQGTDKKYSGLLQPKWNHYTQWKWFFKDIGKQNCILALLPLADIALHVSQTPLPAKYQREMESHGILQDKIWVVAQWAQKPNRESKQQVVARVSSTKPSATGRYSDVGLPSWAAEAFINNLLTIVVAERKFSRHVDFAFYHLKQMGYTDSFVEQVFRDNVKAIYRHKLSSRE